MLSRGQIRLKKGCVIQMDYPHRDLRVQMQYFLRHGVEFDKQWFGSSEPQRPREEENARNE